MRFIKIIFTISLLLPNFSYAAETLKNTGLIPSNIWYSKDPFFVDDRIRIYSVIFNGSGKDLRGRVNFYDNKALICTSDFFAVSQKMSEVWCDWLVSAGKHRVSITITNPRTSAPGEEEQSVSLANSELAINERLVEAAPTVPLDPKNSLADSGPASIEDKKSDSSFIDKVVSFLSNSPSVVVEGNKQNKPSLSFERNTSPILKNDLNRDKNLSNEDINLKNVKPKTSQQALVSFPYINKNIASVKDQTSLFIDRHPVLLAIKDGLSSFFETVREWILSKLKNASTNDSKPLAYTMLFFYIIARFILESPIILALLGLYLFWRLMKFLF